MNNIFYSNLLFGDFDIRIKEDVLPGPDEYDGLAQIVRSDSVEFVGLACAFALGEESTSNGHETD